MPDTHYPASPEELRRILAAAADRKEPIELFGANTKRLMGGPAKEGIRISTQRMQRIVQYEPRDLTLDEALKGINATLHGKGGKGKSISSYHPGGAYVMFADGNLRFLSEDTSPALLKALLTIDGGEDMQALGWK